MNSLFKSEIFKRKYGFGWSKYSEKPLETKSFLRKNQALALH